VRIFTSLALLVALLVGSSARTDEREWYGWQIAVTDAVSIGLVATGRTVPATIGLAGWALGGPIIHVAHEDIAAGAIDLGLRVGLPIGGGLAGAVSGGRCGECEGLPAAAVLGFLAGSLTAMAIDYGVLSTHERVSVAPTLGGALVSLSGRF
jgi:peptidoglycan/LPS O-acetylase OafA/YrhL